MFSKLLLKLESRKLEVVYPFRKDLLPSSRSFIAFKENIIVLNINRHVCLKKCYEDIVKSSSVKFNKLYRLLDE